MEGVRDRYVFVFDPLEERYWGPFAGEVDAELFVDSDKYLASWCITTTHVLVGVPVYLPEDYHGEWPPRV